MPQAPESDMKGGSLELGPLGGNLIGKRAKRAIIASQVRDATRGSPRSFTAQRTLVQDDNRVVGEGDREASQTGDYCVAKCATQRAARPDPRNAKSTLLRMTIEWWVRATGKRAKRAIIASQSARRNARLAQILRLRSGQALRNTKSALPRMTAN